MEKNTGMKALLLLSGGIDSAVAAKLMIDEDVELVALHFSLEPFTNNEAAVKSERIARHLGIKKLYSIACGLAHAKIVKQCNHRYYYIISRRMMLRIAQQMARRENCLFLCTGDNLGQVGSQTLSNMDVISHAVSMPIARPLLTNDKVETIALAKKFGTYQLSIGPEMCSVLGPKNPATRSELSKIEAQEQHLDMNMLLEEQLQSATIISL